MNVVMYFPTMLAGHIAMAVISIDKETGELQFATPENSDALENYYISYYPPNLSSKAYFRLHDLEADGTNVTKIALIPSEELNEKGLSVRAICHWWKNDFKPDTNGYGFFNNRNCSSIVYRALRIGQLQSASLGHKAVVEKNWWIDRPDVIFNYAANIGKTLLQEFIAELKQVCLMGEQDDAYMQACSLYVRIKKYDKTLYQHTLIKPFCSAIQQALQQFQLQLLEQAPNAVPLLLPLLPSETMDVMQLEQTFTRLRLVGDALYNLLPITDQRLPVKLFNTCLQTTLVKPFFDYLNNANLHTLMDQESIQRVLVALKKLIAQEKNPHKDHVQEGSKILLIPWSFTKL